MKKISLGVLCALGILIAGCDTDIPTDEVGTLSRSDMCGLTGGKYIERHNSSQSADPQNPGTNTSSNTNDVTGICKCGQEECEEDVTCVYDDSQKTFKCMGIQNKDLPELFCTLKGQRVCFDRINFDTKAQNMTASGYYVECDGVNWSQIKQCPGGNSCKTYLEHSTIYSTECGECQNDGKTCVNGKRIAQ